MKRSLTAALALSFIIAPLSAQDIRTADSLFRAGQRSLSAGDTAGYERNADSAARMMPAGHLNRPFLQYHAARGHAVTGDGTGAAAWLARMLEENIEGLMAWYSTLDTGFDPIRTSDPYRRILRRMDSVSLISTPLGHGLVLLEGAGGNVVAAPAAQGVFLVDAGYEPGGRALRRALLAWGEPRWIVLTHAHEDHVGGVPALGAGTTVLAHPAAITTLQSPQEFIDGVSAPAKPFAGSIESVTGRRTVSLRGGDSAVVVPMPAHSGGDLLVWFPQAKVLATGDNFLPGANPFLELGGIRDIQGYVAAMGEFLAGLPPDTRVVPGHGKVSSLTDLRAIFEKTRDGIEFVRARKAAGMSLDAIKSEGAALGLGGPWIERAHRRLP